MRHVLSVSACVQTALPFCYQNRCLMGPFMCRNVSVCASTCVCVSLNLCSHMCEALFVWFFLCSCRSFPIFCSPNIIHVFFSTCLTTEKHAAHDSVCVSLHVCVCCSSTYTHTVFQTLKNRKKGHFNRGHFCARSHDLLISKSNTMI